MRVIEIGPAARVFVLFRCDSRVLSLCAFVPRAGAPYVWWVFGFSSLFFYLPSLPTHAFSETHNTHTHAAVLFPVRIAPEHAGRSRWRKCVEQRAGDTRDGFARRSAFFLSPPPPFPTTSQYVCIFHVQFEAKADFSNLGWERGEATSWKRCNGFGPRTRAQH